MTSLAYGEQVQGSTPSKEKALASVPYLLVHEIQYQRE